MNIKEIEELLERYEEGETTLQEEQYLKEFFGGSEIPENMQSSRAIFHYFHKVKKEKISDPEFEVKTNFRLTETPVPWNNSKSKFLYLTSLAAGVLLVIGLFFTFRQDVFKKNVRYDPSSDPAYAYAEVQYTLLSVSANLNIGLDQIRRLETIGNALHSIQKFSKFYQYESIIINPDNQTTSPLNQ